eukprot:EG_transcript_10175
MPIRCFVACQEAAHIPAAGKGPAPASSAAQCLDFTGRPITPPRLKKYASVWRQEVGVPAHLSSAAADSSSADLRHGVKTPHDDPVGWFAPPAESAFAAGQRERQERCYHSVRNQPVGGARAQARSATPEAESPSLTRRRRANSVGVRGLLSWGPAAEPTRGVPPGVAKRRDYDWAAAGMDPVTTRFGRPPRCETDTAASLVHPDDGTATVLVNKVGHDFRDAARRRARGGEAPAVPAGHAFGVPGRRAEGMGAVLRSEGWDAPEVTQARMKCTRHPPPDPSAPLGPVFGAPTIRTNLDRPKVRKLASRLDYGDEPPAGGLINPDPAAEWGLTPDDLASGLGAEEMRRLAQDAGLGLTAPQFEALWRAADAKGTGAVSFADFCAALRAADC